MEKVFYWIVVILIVASVFCGIGCKNEVPNFARDTVLTLDRTNVNAIAYPGMNYISWTPVTNASGYVLYIHENGSCISTKSFNYDDALQYNDINIKNDAEYTYYVESESATSTGRAVVTQNSMSKGVTVKAIVPHKEPWDYVKAWDLPNYENGNYVESNYLRNSEVETTYGRNKICITFPAKVYLTYEVVLIKLDDSTFEEKDILYTTYLSDNAKNDVMLHTDFTLSTPGYYSIKLIVKSVNPHFVDITTSVNLLDIPSWERTAYFYDEDENQIAEPITVTDTGIDDEYYKWNVIQLPSIPEKDGYYGHHWLSGKYIDDYYGLDRIALNSSVTDFYAIYKKIPEGRKFSSRRTVAWVDSGGYTIQHGVSEGTTYTVTWADRLEGEEELEYLLFDMFEKPQTMCDVKVSVYDEYGNTYFTEVDSGYNNPQTFTANTTGYVTINVQPYSGNSGYCAIQITEN